MLCEVSTLGGPARPIIASAGACDISHCGERLAFFEERANGRALVTASRQGLDVRPVTVTSWLTTPPRWSPNDRHLAFQGKIMSRFDERLCIVDAQGGDPQTIARDPSIKGFCWLPGGDGLIYSSSAGSTVPYPPTLNLRTVAADGSDSAQVTFGDDSYVDPDVHPSGKLLACRIRAQSDIWAFPIDGDGRAFQSPARVTRQTGQVQTPSSSPDGRELVYLSDNGGHGNLWVTRVDAGGVRQLTFERDRATAIGAPTWSPTGNRIVFVINRDQPALWLINGDGRGLRQLVSSGFAASWSRDGEWIYYLPSSGAPTWCIEKIHVDSGERIVVRDDHNSHGPLEGAGVFYYARRTERSGREWEICRTALAGGEPHVIARISRSRVPVSPDFIQGALSPDGRWIALPLVDGATTEIWLLPTDGGKMRTITDFGDRQTLVARQVSWAPDGRCIYAAVAETATAVVLLDGLLSAISA